MTTRTQNSNSKCVSEETSRKVRNLGFLCSLFVVSLHIPWPSLGVGGYVGRISHFVLGPASVPFFFAISGFMLAGHFGERGWWKREIRKRFFSLLIPYLAWAVIFLLFQTIWDGVHSWVRGQPFSESLFRGLCPSQWPYALGVDLSKRPQFGVLWYIRCLMVFVLLSPCIFWFIMRIQFLGLFLAFPVVLAYATATKLHLPGLDPSGFFIYGISLEGLWYFSLGSLLRIQPIRISTSIQWMTLTVAGFFIAVHTLDLASKAPINSIVLSTPFVLLGLWICTPSTAWPPNLVMCAFPIYLLHTFFNYVVAWVTTRLNGIIQPFPGQSFMLVSACSISSALTIHHFTPRLGTILFGGR